jgi:hypothetical protein
LHKNILYIYKTIYVYFNKYKIIYKFNFEKAAYWHDPLDDEENYSKYNYFLTDINQVKVFNTKYKNNILKLKSLVLVKFTKDQMVVPIESQVYKFIYSLI